MLHPMQFVESEIPGITEYKKKEKKKKRNFLESGLHPASAETVSALQEEDSAPSERTVPYTSFPVRLPLAKNFTGQVHGFTYSHS